MRIHHLLPLVLLANLAGCDSSKKDAGATATATAEDKKKDDDKKGDKKAKKDDDKAKKDDDKGDAKAAKKDDDKTAPKDSAAASSGAPAAEAPSGLAGLFTGAVDPAVKFERQGQIPNKPVWMQIVPYWKLNLDTPPDEEAYKDLVARGNSDHATIYLWTQKPNPAGIAPTDQSNHCMWVHIPDCKFDPPVDGVLGEGIKVKISEGKGTMMTKPAKLWTMVGDIEGGEQLVVFIGLRTDVYPKLEDDVKAMLKSVKVKHG